MNNVATEKERNTNKINTVILTQNSKQQNSPYVHLKSVHPVAYSVPVKQ